MKHHLLRASSLCAAAIATGVLLVHALGAAVPPAATPAPPAATPEELGRLLFWDPILSGPRNVACASCHHPDFAYADGRALSLGAGARGLGPERTDVSGGAIPTVGRNAPTLLNVALTGARARPGRRSADRTDPLLPVAGASIPMFWDSRVRGLEAQALEPLRMLEEMRGEVYPAEVAVDSAAARLHAIPEYVALFASAFGPDRPIDGSAIADALAAFERTLIALDSPFDRFQRGDSTALTDLQLRGSRTFDRAGCDRCHTGPMFSDFRLRTQGIPESALLTTPDEGAGRFRFRTPSLRNVALTAPYMHNGSLATLEDVLRFYDRGRSENPNVADRRGDRRTGEGEEAIARLDRDFVRVANLSDREIGEIIAFLESLTDPSFDRSVPARVPSGLRPGGEIDR